MCFTTVNSDERVDGLCLIQRLFQVPFSIRTRVSQSDILREGRPTPTLCIKQKVTERKRTYVRKFNPKYYDEVPWLTGCATTHKMYCWPCILFCKLTSPKLWNEQGYNNLNNFSNAKVKHAKSKSHVTAVQALLELSIELNIKVDTLLANGNNSSKEILPQSYNKGIPKIIFQDEIHNLMGATEMALFDDPAMLECNLPIKTEVEMDPLRTEDPTCPDLSTVEMETLSAQQSLQGDVYGMDVKDEPLNLEEGAEDGQFVLQKYEVTDPEVNQDNLNQHPRPNAVQQPPTKVNKPTANTGYCPICHQLFFNIPLHFTSKHGYPWKRTLVCRGQTFHIIGNQCPIDKCERVYCNTQELRLHIKEMHMKCKLQCSCCEKNFYKKTSLIHHLQKMHNIIENSERRLIKCNICKCRCVNLSRHLIQKHNASTIPYVYHGKTFNVVKTYYCPLCHRNFANISDKSWNQHIRSCISKNYSKNKTQEV